MSSNDNNLETKAQETQSALGANQTNTENTSKKFMDNVKTLLSRLVDEEDLSEGLEFYQFIMVALNFVVIEENYNAFFKTLSPKQRKHQLKALMLEGNRTLFKSNQLYRKNINDLFNEDTNIGNVSMLVLQFMHLVQEESKNNNGVKISGARKAAFVKSSVRCFLIFTDLNERQKADIILGLDTLIIGYILVKNNFLQHVTLDDIKKKCKCLPFC
jgi:hypothetical protein